MIDAATGAFGWFNIATSQAQSQMIKEHQDASVYYMNRVKLSISKLPSADKSVHTSLCTSFQAALGDLDVTVREKYPDGFWARSQTGKYQISTSDLLARSFGHKKDIF